MATGNGLQDELRAVHGLTGLRIDLAALRALQPALAQAGRAVTVTVWQGREIVRVQPGFHDGTLWHRRRRRDDDGGGPSLPPAHGRNAGDGQPHEPAGALWRGPDEPRQLCHDERRRHGAHARRRLSTGSMADRRCCAEAGIDIAPTTLSRSCWSATPPCTTCCSASTRVNWAARPFSLVTHAAVDVKARDLGLQHCPRRQRLHPPLRGGPCGGRQCGRACCRSAL